MKVFAGQRQFQAPVADDFARGMPASGQANNTGESPLNYAGRVLAALINGLAGWRR